MNRHQEGGFYSTDYTKSLLFLADGTYLEDQAVAQHLGGDQWGMMNETGSYPGQSWLWLYTFWYQIDPFKSLCERRRAGLGPPPDPPVSASCWSLSCPASARCHAGSRSTG